MAAISKRSGWATVAIVVMIQMALEIMYLLAQKRKLKAIIEDPKKYFRTLARDDTVPSFSADTNLCRVIYCHRQGSAPGWKRKLPRLQVRPYNVMLFKEVRADVHNEEVQGVDVDRRFSRTVRGRSDDFLNRKS